MESDRDQFQYYRVVFSSHLKSKVDNILGKDTTLWITLNIDGSPIVSKSHSPNTLTNLSFINLVSIFRGSSPSSNPVYARRVDPSVLAFSLSSHRYSFIGLLFSSRFIV